MSTENKKPDDNESGSPLTVLKFLWPYIRPYKKRLAYAMLGLVIAAVAMLAIGEGLKRVVDQGFGEGGEARLNMLLIAMVGLAIAQGVGVFVRFSNIAWVNQRVVNDVRRGVYAHLLALSPAFFERERVGDVLSRLSNDTQVLEGVVSNAFSWALRNLALMLGALVMLFITSPKLTLLVVVATPLIVSPMLVLGRRVRALSKDTQDQLADAMARSDETIHAVRTVQAYARESHELTQFGTRIQTLFVNSAKRERLSAMLTALVIVFAFTGISLILWVGGHDVIAKRMSAGELSAFIFYAVMMASAVGAISEVYGQLKRAEGASHRIRELLQTVSEVRESPQAKPLLSPARELRFENVTFCYPSRPDSPALRDFSLQARAGEVVALVGPSGAGKSSVFQLLLRYYDAQSGRVVVNETDVREATLASLRGSIALVSQEPVIFSGSVMDNVRYGRLDASDADVRAACDAAHVTEFAHDLPQGFATELGERGVRLSGGQKQRVALARAMLADRAILLLDEATSALDSESEALVTDALERLARDAKAHARERITMVIAHRLSTIQSADRIVVMEDGRVVAQGTHTELLANSALYQRLAARQFTENG
jgi:ATP-binding cassette, subfamily B, bacterial